MNRIPFGLSLAHLKSCHRCQNLHSSYHFISHCFIISPQFMGFTRVLIFQYNFVEPEVQVFCLVGCMQFIIMKPMLLVGG